MFTNVLLSDEINRASPKVQSALLECMAENQISAGDTTFQLDKFFFTIATQNPIEMEGTYPLPAAQLDRFFMKITFGYVTEEVELDIYNNYLSIGNVKDSVKQVLTYDDVIHLQQEAENVYLHSELVKSVVKLVQSTRAHQDIALGCSTRGGIIFIKCLKAWALVNQRNYVIEDDIRMLAHPVLHHRMIFRNREASKVALQQLTDHEVNHTVNGLKQFADSDLILVAESDGKPIAVSVTLPNVNHPLRMAYPNPKTPEILTLLKFLWYRRKNVNAVRFVLLGVLASHRMSGIDAVLIAETIKVIEKRGYIGGEFGWILETNEPMNRIAAYGGGHVYRTYRLYDLAI